MEATRRVLRTIPGNLSARSKDSRLAWIGRAIIVLVYACTPISPSNKAAVRTDAEPSTAGSQAQAAQMGEQTISAMVGESCKSGARSCGEGNPSRQPLLCEESAWRARPLCNESQRCDMEPGDSLGTCVAIARECIGRAPDEAFCDGSDVRICSGGISSILRRCMPGERCTEQNGALNCGCGTGMIERAGECVVASTCDIDDGGCDRLTTCSVRGNTRVCGACPPGYVGDGDRHGCAPVLIDLKLGAGELTPPLAADLLEYRASISLLQREIMLTPKVAAGVRVEINGEKLEAGMAWRSRAVSFAEQTIVLNLTAESGLTTRYSVNVQRKGVQEAYLKQRFPDAGDAFGYTVAIDGDTVVVGACGEDGSTSGLNGDESSNGTIESGAVYIYERNNGEWHQTAYLKAPNTAPTDYFGGTVAIDGDTLLVAASRSNMYDAVITPNRPGAVYVYKRNGKQWTYADVIKSPRTISDAFGFSLAINKEHIVIGAAFDDDGGERSGAVYATAREGDLQLQKIRAPDAHAGDMFGNDIALDGDTLLVGSPQAHGTPPRNGAAYAFVRAADGWKLDQKLDGAPDQAGAGFGFDVALFGDTAAVAAPFPGDPHLNMTDSPSGTVLVYERAAGAWHVTTQLRAPTPRTGDFFGASVAMSAGVLFVGASGDTSDAGGFNADPNHGNLMRAGAFYLYGREASGWGSPRYIKASNPSSNAVLGDASAISGDTIVVGAEREDQSGAAYVFR